jgi:hypothetical protein
MIASGPGRYAAQALLYAAFAAFVGFFSTSPSIRLLEPDEGLLRLSFKQPGKPREACRKRSEEELAKLPPQLRVAEECPRERSPVHIRVALDDRVLVDRAFPPAGLQRDGASSGYLRVPIAAGEHRLDVRVNDDARVDGPTHTRAETLKVAPGQVVLIDFQPERGGVIIR